MTKRTYEGWAIKLPTDNFMDGPVRHGFPRLFRAEHIAKLSNSFDTAGAGATVVPVRVTVEEKEAIEEAIEEAGE